MTTITYTPRPLSCPFESIDHLTDCMKDLAEVLDHISTLTEEDRCRINDCLTAVARTQRHIDDAAELLEDRYNIADAERDEFWQELEGLKHAREHAPKPGPHLENDLYTAIHHARTTGCKQVLLPYEVAELAHAIILTLEN